MIRAVYIDDELHCLERLSRLLLPYITDTIQLVGMAQSVDEGVDLIEREKPDLVFLDVQIHQQTGFDLLQQIRPVTFDVIFTTAFEQYAVQAFKFSAIDYLLKPVDPDDLRQALAKLAPKQSVISKLSQVDTLLYNLQQRQESAKRICISTSTGYTFVDVKDIIRCQSDINYTTIFLNDKTKIVASKTLKEFEEVLREADFFRVHNSHLINLSYLKSYHKGKGGSVIMVDNTEIDVSTRRKDEFLKRILAR